MQPQVLPQCSTKTPSAPCTLASWFSAFPASSHVPSCRQAFPQRGISRLSPMLPYQLSGIQEPCSFLGPSWLVCGYFWRHRQVADCMDLGPYYCSLVVITLHKHIPGCFVNGVGERQRCNIFQSFVTKWCFEVLHLLTATEAWLVVFRRNEELSECSLLRIFTWKLWQFNPWKFQIILWLGSWAVDWHRWIMCLPVRAVLTLKVIAFAVFLQTVNSSMSVGAFMISSSSSSSSMTCSFFSFLACITASLSITMSRMDSKVCKISSVKSETTMLHKSLMVVAHLRVCATCPIRWRISRFISG